MGTRPAGPGRPDDEIDGEIIGDASGDADCDPGDDPGEAAELARRRAARRARLDSIFGDVLPATNGEEAARDRSRERGGGSDAWLRSNVPPHHG